MGKGISTIDELAEFKAYKIHTKSKIPGKFVKRPKNQRPVDHLKLAKAGRCRKRAYSSLEQAKEALKSFRYAQQKAVIGDVTTSHREVRYYQCENCGYGSKTAIWHLTSLSLENYHELLATSRSLGNVA
jgi:hypothetical protein